jgi:hypothetical protein
MARGGENPSGTLTGFVGVLRFASGLRYLLAARAVLQLLYSHGVEQAFYACGITVKEMGFSPCGKKFSRYSNSGIALAANCLLPIARSRSMAEIEYNVNRNCLNLSKIL